MKTLLIAAITEYDRKQEKKTGFNRYALAQYLSALDKVDGMVKFGRTWEDAVYTWFCGPLEQKLQKVVSKNSHLKGGV